MEINVTALGNAYGTAHQHQLTAQQLGSAAAYPPEMTRAYCNILSQQGSFICKYSREFLLLNMAIFINFKPTEAT